MHRPRTWQRIITIDLGILSLLALARILLHTLINSQYGFHRDELLTFDNARHLSWGYVVYPPLTPFFGRLSLELFGNSLRGFRFFPAVVQGLVMIFTGLATRELGGQRRTQLLAVLAVCISGNSLFSGSFMSYSSFDCLWWLLAGYFVIRLLNSEDPRWCVAIGATVGLGLMTKYTMSFLLFGVLGGMLLTPSRRFLKSPWFWCGTALAALIVLPNLLWQIQHHFISYEFLKSIHVRDIRNGSTDYFLLNQFWKSANPVTVPLWCAGLWFLFVMPDGKRYRLLGWMYILPLLALLAARGRDYYLAAAYPMLLAAGAVWSEQWRRSLGARAALAVQRTTWRVFAVAGLATAALTLPIAPLNSTWWHVADGVMGGNFNSEVGWPDVVESVAKIRDSLPAQDQKTLGILAGDDGEVGAVNLYGPAHGLPTAISGMNSNWLRGYGNPPPQTVITLGFKRDTLDAAFASCTLAGHLSNRYGITNEVIGEYSDLFVCRELRQSWPEFWQKFHWFG